MSETNKIETKKSGFPRTLNGRWVQKVVPVDTLPDSNPCDYCVFLDECDSLTILECGVNCSGWFVAAEPVEEDKPDDATMTAAKAKRDPIGVRYDLISPVAMKRLAVTYCEGAKRYGDRNWEKGLPVSNLVNHALAHIFAYLGGNTAEDDLIHAAWNLMAAAHMEETMPEMVDIPSRLNHRENTEVENDAKTN